MTDVGRRRRLTGPVAFGLVLAVVAFGSGAFSRWATRTEAVSVPTVLPMRPSEVRRVVVESADRRVELIRDGDGSWSGDSRAPAQSITLMFTLEERLFPLPAYRSLRGEGSGPEYGLSDPEIAFRVEDREGRERSVVFGAATFTGGGFYARRADDARRLYLVPRRMVDDLRSLLAGQRIDAPNEVPARIRAAEEKAKAEAEKVKVSWWLQQVLDSDAPLPDGVQ